MLAKKFRLTKQKELKEVFQKGRKGFGYLIGIRFLANNLENSRITVVVSNKVSKKATRRNRLKRQAREIIRLNLDNLNNSYDIIVTILPTALNKEYEDLEKELMTLFKKNKLV